MKKTKEKNKRGRRSTITLKVDKKELGIADRKIKQIFKTRIKEFAKSGGYIPISQKYKNHKALVIVLERGS